MRSDSSATATAVALFSVDPMKRTFLRCLLMLMVMTWVSCGDAPEEYAGQAEIQEDLNRLYDAKARGDEVTIMEVSNRLLASQQTFGAVRITPLLYRAEVLARRGKIEDVNALFDQQFPFVSKSTGGCGQAVFISMKAEVWQEVGRLDLAIADYNVAIEKCPSLDNAYSQLSRIHSTAADPRYIDVKKAIALAQKAVEINMCSKSLDAIAAAYAKAGQYDQAVANIEKAIEAAEKEHQHPAKIESFRKMLSTYQSKTAQ
jgi:tetratricopeptide (TPR) repeat protein